MPDYSVSITDTEKKILDYDIVGISTWINNAVEAKINSTQGIIIAKNAEHCNQNGIAIGVGVTAQIDQAYSLGVIKTAEQRNADFTPPA